MYLVTPAAIGSVLALTPPVMSLPDLEKRMRDGLPVASLRAVAERIARTPDEHRDLLLSVFPEAAERHYLERAGREESERAGRLARIFAMAEYAWDSAADAREFLAIPHVQLGGCTPLDASMTEEGARRVEGLIAKLFFGISV